MLFNYTNNRVFHRVRSGYGREPWDIDGGMFILAECMELEHSMPETLISILNYATKIQIGKKYCFHLKPILDYLILQIICRQFNYYASTFLFNVMWHQSCFKFSSSIFASLYLILNSVSRVVIQLDYNAHMRWIVNSYVYFIFGLLISFLCLHNKCVGTK